MQPISLRSDERTPIKQQIHVGGQRKSVPEWIEIIGFGRGQLGMGIVVNGVWLADGSEALMIASVTCMVAAEWHLTPMQSGLLSAIVYSGTLVGSLLSGRLGDAAGRRLPILCSYPLIILFSILSAGASNYVWLMVFRFGVGVGFGIGQPSAVTAMVEISPVAWRAMNQGMAQVAYAMGEMITCLAMWIDESFTAGGNWRWLLLAGALPSLFFWISTSFLLFESPAFMAQTDPQYAEESLKVIARANGRPDLDISIARTASPSAGLSLHRQLQLIFGGRMFLNTLLLCFVSLSYNLVIYGCFFAFPQVLPDVGLSVQPVSAALALGALVEIPFDIIGIFVGILLSRRSALLVYFVGVIASTTLFVTNSGGDPAKREWTESAMLHLGYFGLKGFPQIGSVVLFIFASEIYPVTTRVGGTAVVLGAGRIGAVASSVVYESMWQIYGSFHPFFHMSAALTLLSMMAVFLISEDESKEIGMDAWSNRVLSA
eukprot:TRINITY_DN63382_c0_g1_i1.p1 TRINITY_DN63382_c0_g1~~TRINITY_DN63382_c0_g1_i1.p1  ORF type:complete len:487 (+),score=53.61 TRINITY_DN63382_c0_g1_i1:146-1606(+)